MTCHFPITSHCTIFWHTTDELHADAGLVPLVQLLCAEMGHAFEARAMTCPPWRQAKAMLSKWLPAKVGLLLCRQEPRHYLAMIEDRGTSSIDILDCRSCQADAFLQLVVHANADLQGAYKAGTIEVGSNSQILTASLGTLMGPPC